MQFSGQRFFGTGAPTENASNGSMYVDVTTYTQYFYYNGAWHVIGANAVQIQGVKVATTAPTNGQNLQYASSTTDWVPTSPTP